jgi:hypothetical protein
MYVSEAVILLSYKSENHGLKIFFQPKEMLILYCNMFTYSYL